MSRPRTGCCPECKVILTKENTRPRVFRLGHGRCRICDNAYLRKWRDDNKERCLETQRALRKKKSQDPAYVEERRQKQRQYDIKRNKNPLRIESRKVWLRERVKTDSAFVEKQKIRLAVYYTTIEGKHAKLKVALREENVSSIDPLWDINFYQALILDNRCHYCLGPLKLSGHSLDRMENSLGHVCYNVVPSCWDCNELKGIRLSYKEMMLLAPVLQEIREQRESASGDLNGYFTNERQFTQQ